MAETLGVGTRLGNRYEILEHLKGGGFGQTYVAKDHHRPRKPQCLVKQLQPRSTAPNDLTLARQLFPREAESLQRLGDIHDQIPRLLAHFEENEEFYIVMEYIEGEQLSVNQGWTEDKVVSLLQDILQILEFIHQNNVIHRDIKPSNVIRRSSDGKIFLIDFGAVKQVTIENEELTQTVLGTLGYMPNEQAQGNPHFCSDIYALGMLGIHLLTNKSPIELDRDSKTGEVIWNIREEASPELEEVLGKMVRYDFTRRYQTVTQVLEALENLPNTSHQGDDITIPIPSVSKETPPPLVPPFDPGVKPPIIDPKSHDNSSKQTRNPITRTWKRLGLLAIVLIVVVLIYLTQPQPVLSSSFSLGEKILIQDSEKESKVKALKDEAAQAFAQRKFDTAISKLNESLKLKRNDPEALIYLNNAKAEQQGKTLRIAVSVPISSNPDIAQEMLRGVAQSQDKLNRNRGIDGTPLQVQIADDDNKAETAKQIASALAKDQKIMAVVGHNASEASIAAAPIYQSAGLVMVSPTSGAKNLTENNLTKIGKGNYIFRTVPSVDVDADNLAKHLQPSANTKRFAMCFDDLSPYSRDLASTFKQSMEKIGGQFSRKSCDLSEKSFDAAKFIEEAKKDKVNSLLVAPSVEKINDAINLVRNRGDFALFGGSTMYSYKILQQGKAVNDMVLAVAWHADAKQGDTFPDDASNLWGGDTKVVVNWRTAMSYDATQAIIQGLMGIGNTDDIRSRLRDKLATNTQATGATGNIAFTDSGDRKLEGGGLGILVKVEQRPGTANEYKFSYLDPAKVVPPS
jgi:ABC-type branched-subunit amino acid transport system substrate-binding protein